ncbi:MAG: DUF3566 domain-containing protein [Propionibacteriaceae bacterium]|nr:DUF3566 domain-containing protein [Propionibacteriaceae bacterium]
MTDTANVPDTTANGSPEWADKVVKLPKIPAEGPVPGVTESKVASKPVLPPPPAVRKAKSPATPQRDVPPADKQTPARSAPAKSEPVKPRPANRPPSQQASVADTTQSVDKAKAAEETKAAEQTTPRQRLLPRKAPKQPTVPIPAVPAGPDMAPAQVQDPVKPAVTVAPVKKKRGGIPRRASLQISRVDPWSAMKITFMFSVALGIMFFVAVYASWTVIESGGAFDKVNDVLDDILNADTGGAGWHVQDYVSGSRVLGFAALIAAVNVLIMTALGTLAAFLYNLAATVIGGIEVTLKED